MRRKILEVSLVPLALGGPFAGPLFALLSALQSSLWMRCRLYPRLLRFLYVMLIKHEMCPFVKNFFSQAADKCRLSENCLKYPETLGRFCVFLQTRIPYIDFSPGS